MPKVEEVIQLTNEYRAQQGLPLLKINPQLMAAAKYRADDMSKTGIFSHTAATTSATKLAKDFIKSKGYSSLQEGENLAQQFPDARSTVEAWKASPTHKAVMSTKAYQDIGVAVTPRKDGGYYVVQLFAQPMVQPKRVLKSTPDTKLAFAPLPSFKIKT